jgi:hypothetical protein
MPLTWTPDPATVPWHDVQADEVWTEGPITATYTYTYTEPGDEVGTEVEVEAPVIGYDCEVVGPEPLGNLHVHVDEGGVTASAPDTLIHVFPPIDIEYQIKRETYHCATLGELPVEADEVIHFIPNPSNTKDWALRVIAHFIDPKTNESLNFTADFVLRVWANFDPGRDALKEAVDARRR